jgi:hypothetical protein
MATKHAIATAIPTNVKGDMWVTEQQLVVAVGGLMAAEDILVIRTSEVALCPLLS